VKIYGGGLRVSISLPMIVAMHLLIIKLLLLCLLLLLLFGSTGGYTCYN
jgi:hypothetical protein